jgi:aspartyl-tRNA(Asn)/glutamyl-tRNA(Gln) amidotransferase subunit A
MGGVFPFAQSFDDVGPFTTSVADMRCIWQVLTGTSGHADHAGDVRVARLGGRFRENADRAQLAAIDAIAPDAPIIELPDIARARSAAFVITAFEGGALHAAALGRAAMQFDPATRDRLIAGALLPHALYDRAQAFRLHFKQKIAELVAEYDVLLAPAAPCVAPPIADPQIMIDGAMVPARSDLGVHTQPISFTGWPALAVPLRRPGQLPLGLQLIGKPGGEAALLHFAAMLEDKGWTGHTMPVGEMA